MFISFDNCSISVYGPAMVFVEEEEKKNMFNIKTKEFIYFIALCYYSNYGVLKRKENENLKKKLDRNQVASFRQMMKGI